MCQWLHFSCLWRWSRQWRDGGWSVWTSWNINKHAVLRLNKRTANISIVLLLLCCFVEQREVQCQIRGSVNIQRAETVSNFSTPFYVLCDQLDVNEVGMNFTFWGPCVVIYSYNRSQQDALFLKFILI